MFDVRVVVIVLAIVLSEVHNDEAFFKFGWYKIKTKERRRFISNISSFDNATLFNTNYLRIISNSSLNEVPAGAVKNLLNLKCLELTNCGIKNVAPGAFENLPNLDRLELQDNKIEHIPKGLFNNLLISALSLQRNNISSIDTSAFDDMPNLYKIKLNLNRIHTWDNNWFRNSPMVTEVFFRRNHLKEVPANAFKNLHGNHLGKNKNTVDLKIYLSKNKISYVHPEALNGLEVFSQLWLDRNELEQLDVGIFSKVRQINVLFLSRNSLKMVEENMFPRLETDMEVLDFRSNNLTCLPPKIVALAKMTNLENNRFLDCDCIKNLRTQLVLKNKTIEIATHC